MFTEALGGCLDVGGCLDLMNIAVYVQAQLAFKHRVLDSEPEVYRCCDTLQQTFSRLYRQAGISGGSSHSGRRTLAAKVLAATGDVEMVQILLGHACLSHTKPYLTVDQGTLRRAFELAL
ncbi:hypothetical protein ALP01_200046 [Pseudomonas caricapapayae]|nr:hypothetical protein ALP01_200046 [Pseudomonas caricapapayae]